MAFRNYDSTSFKACPEGKEHHPAWREQEESLLAIEQNIAEYEIAQHRSEYLPRFTSSVETKAFDVDNYDGDMQVSLNLLGEFGLFDGGKSDSQIRALVNKAFSVGQRQLALRRDLETRLSSLKSEIDSAKKSVEQTKKDVIFQEANFKAFHIVF